VAPQGFAGILDVEIIARDEQGRIARIQVKVAVDSVVVEEGEAPPKGDSVPTGPLADWEKDKAEKDADGEGTLSDKAPADRAADKNVKHGALSFRDQVRTAKTRDPVLARILSSVDRPEKRPS
jgi:hypothetical protein